MVTPSTPKKVQQLAALSQDLPEPGQQALAYLEQQWQETLQDPDNSQIGQQLEQWQQHLQEVVNGIPVSSRANIITAIPGVNTVAAVIQAKQAWNFLPEWAQDTLISAAAIEGECSLVEVLQSVAEDKGVDPVVVSLDVMSLAHHLGWLDGL